MSFVFYLKSLQEHKLMLFNEIFSIYKAIFEKIMRFLRFSWKNLTKIRKIEKYFGKKL